LKYIRKYKTDVCQNLTQCQER